MATLRTHDLTKSYGGRTVVRGVSLEVASGEVVGLLGPNGAGKTTTFYMTVGLTAPDSGRVLLDGDGRHRRSDVHPGAEGHRLPAAGAVDLPRADRRAEHPGHPRDAGRSTARPGGRGCASCSPSSNLTPLAQRAGLHAVGRRAPPGRDHARAGRLAAVHPARRAVRRHRPDRGRRHPEDHLPPEGAGHRRPHHRPQRARDAADHRPGLHRARRRRSSGAARRTAWRPTRTSGGFTSGPTSGWTKYGSAVRLRAGHETMAISAETPHEARSEAHPDAVAAAGDQAAADVDARARRAAQPGDGREPDARGGADRGAPAGRGGGGAEKAGGAAEGARRATPGTTRTTSTSSATTSTTATARARRRKSRNCRHREHAVDVDARSPIT